MSEPKIIKVTNCRKCPFAGFQMGMGYVDCNLNNEIIAVTGQLPNDKVHDLCPLKKEFVLVELDEVQR